MSDQNRDLAPHDHDFGDDADDIVLPVDPAFDAWVSGAAPLVNAPPSAPRREMWDVIAARGAQSQSVPAGVEVRPLRRPQFFLPAALAAALILGIGIDRVIQSRQTVGQQDSSTVAIISPNVPPTPADLADPAKLYRMAAQQTLSQAEALLTAYRASGVATRDPESVRQLAVWGRQVLSSTRLLIDSPAGDDPRLKPLLEDLEVVLVQIIRLSGAPLEQSERDLIDGAISNRHLLPRLRSAVPARAGDSATD